MLIYNMTRVSSNQFGFTCSKKYRHPGKSPISTKQQAGHRHTIHSRIKLTATHF